MAKLDTGGPGTLLAMSQPSILDLVSFGPNGWGQALAAGATMTILIALAGFFIGGLIGTAGAWAKISGGPAVRFAAETYTTVLRGIPDLLVIYLFYFGGSAVVSAVGRLFGAEGFVSFPGFLAGALAVGVTSGAQQTEVFRGAFRAVHPGELEAATACGMGRALKFRRVVAPLTLRHALPGLGNVWQVVLKESALVSVTGVVELLRQAQIGAGSTSLPFDFYLIAALIYLAISTLSGFLLHTSERRFSRGVRRG
ncbi:amine acid ABC transporter, permease protein His/Glu/Gln/Arg/opine family [Shinella sp. DD12]|jgi:octopine/nopaline transport system permease protein|nr:amine acid ABC transporter, permease protein His/Glu/Gln/Arg/opine family [Shinella sp. DD12]